MSSVEQSTPIAKTQPRSPSMTEQQHLDANPAQFSNGSFGAVPPQEEGGEIVSSPHNFWGAAPYSPGIYHLVSSPDPLTYTNAFNVPDCATKCQPFGYQYVSRNVDPVPRDLLPLVAPMITTKPEMLQPIRTISMRRTMVIRHRRQPSVGRS